MTVFSQMWQVCSTLFWLSYRILIHAGSMPLYLSQLLVLLTPLSWEIQMKSRIAHTCLILNGSCHGGHLKIGSSKCILISWASHCWVGRLRPWDTCLNIASVSIVSFHTSVNSSPSVVSSPLPQLDPPSTPNLWYSYAPGLALFLSLSSKKAQVVTCWTWVYKGAEAKQSASWLKKGNLTMGCPNSLRWW